MPIFSVAGGLPERQPRAGGPLLPDDSLHGDEEGCRHQVQGQLRPHGHQGSDQGQASDGRCEGGYGYCLLSIIEIITTDQGQASDGWCEGGYGYCLLSIIEIITTDQGQASDGRCEGGYGYC